MTAAPDPADRVARDAAAAAPRAAFVSSRARTRAAAWPLRVFGWLSSLWLAATLIAAAVVVIGAATWYERDYGRLAVASMIYDAWWFRGLGCLLAVNIFGAAAVRWPWKPRQYGFVVVHLGLLSLLASRWLSHDRLDGILVARPGEPARSIELPRDRLAVDGGGAVEFDARAEAGYPSLPRYLAAQLGLAATVEPAVHALARPRTLIDGGADGVTVRLRRVLDCGRQHIGFVAADHGEPALKLALTARPPGGVELPAGAKWLDLGKGASQDFDTLPTLPVRATLGRTASAEAAADFLAPPPIACADGELAVYWRGKRQRVALTPRALPQTIDVDDLHLVVDMYVLRPSFDGHDLKDDPAMALDPFVRVRVREGDAGEWSNEPVFALMPGFAAAGDGDVARPTLLFEHPACYAPRVGEQGLQVQGLIGPDAKLRLRWIRASRGFAGSALVEAGAWSGAVVGGDGDAAPMRLTLDATYLPAAEPGPEAVRMRPEASDQARRWIEVEVAKGGASATGWLGLYSAGAIDLPSGPVNLEYRPARYDLQQRHGFSIELKRFIEGKDPGGIDSASFASQVDVIGADGSRASETIDMNHPLRIHGVALYQSSFEPIEDAQGRPVPGAYRASVFTAATDPGWPLTWLGASLLVGGILLMYVGPWGLIACLAADAVLSVLLLVLHY